MHVDSVVVTDGGFRVSDNGISGSALELLGFRNASLAHGARGCFLDGVAADDVPRICRGIALC